MPATRKARRRDRGDSTRGSPEKAARIANTSRQKAGEKGGRHPRYEDWSVEALYQKAQEIGITQRSEMNKDELIKALRSH